MNSHENEVLLESLLSKLEQILNCKDESTTDDTSFVSWLRPGLAFQPDFFKFIEQPALSNETLNNAESFANQVNAIPTSCGGEFVPSSANLAQIYEKVLQKSKITKDELSDEEKQKIERMRSKLTVTQKRINPITEVEEEITEDSPLKKEYENYMYAYQEALLNYNSRRISAINNGGAVLQDFALNGTLYKSAVKHAMDNWITKGYKKDFETLAAYLQQMMSKSAALQKSNLVSLFDSSLLKSPVSGYSFPYTQFYPARFAESDNGWTEITFSSKESDMMEKTSSQSTTATVGFVKGLFSGDANGGYSKNEHHVSMEKDDFSIKFKVSQVFISRPWFSLDFLTSNNWDWDEKPLSDGAERPSGQLIGFPTAAVFVKDVEIASLHIKSTFDEVEQKISAGVTVGWGPFRFGGKHESASKETHTTYDEKTGTLKIEGLQLVAYKCHRLPKTPDCRIDKSQLF